MMTTLSYDHGADDRPLLGENFNRIAAAHADREARYVRIVEDFPMTASGKVRKVDMRKTAITMLGLADIAAPQYA